MAYANSISYPDFLAMTPNEIYSVFRGKIKSREQLINDNLLVVHAHAQLVTVALFDGAKYPHNPPTIKIEDMLKPKTKEQILAEIEQFRQQNQLEMMKLGGAPNV